MLILGYFEHLFIALDQSAFKKAEKKINMAKENYNL